MIKNILFTFISVFCLIVNANANIKISSDVVDNSIKETFIGEQNQASALATWKENIENDGSISALAVWRVCWAGGLDIKNKSEDKNKCQIFGQNLLKDSSLKYRTTCQKNAGEGTYCIDDFFANSFYGGTQVGLSDAIMLAKEWARINHADDSLECDNKVITVKPKNILARASDDYAILCASKNRKTYYEFVFDDIGESDSGAIFNSVGAATCKLFNTKANVPTLACIARTPEHIENTNGNCQPVSCDSDANTCGKINSTLAKFGYTGVYKNNKCEIFFNNVSDKKGLKTAFGINSFEFCKGIKVQNTPSVEALLKQHIVKNAKVDISDVSCSPGHRIYKGPGCSDDGKDDIKTCYAQGQQIDFVFDDINTFIKEYHQGGIQGMECVISGGTFSGQHCAHLNQEQCDALAKSDVSRCSVCRDIEWDKENNICKLKNAENANDLEKTINIAQLAAATTAAVFTGGVIAFTAVKVGTVAFTVPVLLTLVNVTGQIMEFVGTLEAKGIAKEFIIQSNNCNDSNCADLLVKDWLQRLSNLRNELTKAEYNGINEELARLLKMTSKKFKENMAMNILIEYSRGANKGDISANVQKKFQELYESPDLLESNKKGFFDKDSWEPEQVLRAVGIGLQIVSTIGSAVYSWHQENKALAATRDALNEGYDGITHDPAKREAVKKQLANANIVDAGSIKASGETATSKQLYNTKTGAKIARTPDELPPLRDGYVRVVHRTDSSNMDSLIENGLIYNAQLANKEGVVNTNYTSVSDMTKAYYEDDFWKALTGKGLEHRGADTSIVFDMPVEEFNAHNRIETAKYLDGTISAEYAVGAIPNDGTGNISQLGVEDIEKMRTMSSNNPLPKKIETSDWQKKVGEAWNKLGKEEPIDIFSGGVKSATESDVVGDVISNEVDEVDWVDWN